ncbi:MAG TPA: 50S ribosomal protein L11 methyltransferase [Candidatus Binatia bacterium]|nr:50S ribosomal protein L11 methyltransferase [Candidatus Binatia bacterium]
METTRENAHRQSLWRVCVLTTVEAEEAVAELLEGAYGQAACSYTDSESGATIVSVYLADRPGWSRRRRAILRAGLERMSRCGLRIGPGKLSLERVPRENWAESWKRHFRPLEIGSRLLLKPSWSRRRPRPGQAVVVLDPGLSFGTGQHPTTAFCLQQMVGWRRAGESQGCLDIGTGSGILAIAATKLGYGPVEGLDVDAEAIRVARANAGRNRVLDRIRFVKQDLRGLVGRARGKYLLVCANLVADLLLSERERVIGRVETGGLLVLAGILEGEFPGVQRAYEAAGLRLRAVRTQGEWRSGSFV